MVGQGQVEIAANGQIFSVGVLLDFNEKGGMDITGVSFHAGWSFSTFISFSVTKPQ